MALFLHSDAHASLEMGRLGSGKPVTMVHWSYHCRTHDELFAEVLLLRLFWVSNSNLEFRV